MPKLENWSVGARNPWAPPELRQPALHGKVTGHPRKPDGSEVTTSPIVSAEGDKIQTLTGTLYELGDVDPTYEVLYPNAKVRLFETYGIK